MHQQLSLLGYEVEHLVNVCLGNLVRRVGHRAVAFRLGLQFPLQPSLLRNLNHLVIDDAVRIGDGGEECKQVGGYLKAVDRHGLEGSDERGQVDHVHIHEIDRFQYSVAQVQVLVTALEVAHGKRPLFELEGHEAVQVLVHLLTAELVVAYATLSQYVHYLAHLDMEVEPQLRVVFYKRAARCLLRDGEVGLDFRIRPPFIVSEVGLREERHVWRDVVVVTLSAEDVLLLQRIPLSECLYDVVQHIGIGEVLVLVGTVLLDGILHLYDDGAVALVGEQHRVEMMALFVLHVLKLCEQAVHGFLLAKHPGLLSCQ